MFDPGPGRNDFREAKPSRKEPRGSTSDPREFTWFRLDIGRKNNADPKWLLPMICRRGKVTKVDIGAIRITDNETRFEIANAAVERFTLASIVADDEDVKIERVSGGAGVVHTSRNPERKPNFKPKPEGEVRYEDRKPFVDPDKPKSEGYKGKKPFGGKPKYEGTGKPKFEGAGKPRGESFKPKYEGAPKPTGEGGKPPFKEKKSAWKKRK